MGADRKQHLGPVRVRHWLTRATCSVELPLRPLARAAAPLEPSLLPPSLRARVRKQCAEKCQRGADTRSERLGGSALRTHQ